MKDWFGVSRAVSGRINNYYSKNDEVLRLLYSAGTLFTSAPIGRHAIAIKSKKVRNIDVTRVVGGHTEFKPNLSEFIRS